MAATPGSAIPVKFGLGGDRGLDVIDAGYPKSSPYACGAAGSAAAGIPTSSPGASSLSYDPSTKQYKYNWKTEKSWKNTCRQFILRLRDGTEHRFNVSFR